MWWALALLGCGDVGTPEGGPPRLEVQPVTRARSWVRNVVTDGEQVVWANYDVSTGKSARATIDRVALAGGERVELAEEHHPPADLQLAGGYAWWHYRDGALKRVPLTGGTVERVFEKVPAACFGVDDSGAYWFEDGTLVHLDVGTGQTRVVGEHLLGDCPLPWKDQIYWMERKGIHAIPKAGGEEREVLKVTKPTGLQVYDDALYACLDDILTRVDPLTGETTKVRSYCRGEGLAIGPNAHWFPVPHFEGWPPVEKVKLAEVTSSGVSWLYDGEGVSPVVAAEGRVFWFARPRGGSSDWAGYSVVQP